MALEAIVLADTPRGPRRVNGAWPREAAFSAELVLSVARHETDDWGMEVRPGRIVITCTNGRAIYAITPEPSFFGYSGRLVEGTPA